MKTKLKIILIAFAILSFSCSTEKEAQKSDSEEINPLFKNSINVNISKVLAWINMMPNSETRFNITGEMHLLKTDDIRLNEVKLSEIKIYQQTNLVYRIKPIIKWNNDDITSRKFTFSTLKGLNLIPTLNDDKRIDALFEFEYQGDKLLYFVQAIPIEKAH